LRTELEDITMDVKKFFADLAAMYRKPAEPPPPAPVVDVDAAHEAGRKAGYEDGHAEGYDDGYKKGYDEGFQIALEAKNPQEPPPPPERPSQPEPPAEEPQSS
jgi:hypothetical protein